MKTKPLPILKKILLLSITGLVVLFSIINLPQPFFIIPMLVLLLLWIFSFYLEGIYRAADIPILFLLLGTFALGRAFSLIGINIAHLPLYVTEISMAASLGLLLLKGKSLWNEWESPLPKGLAAAIIVYFLLGTIYLFIGVTGNGAIALRDIVFCHYMLFLFITLSLFTSPGKIKALIPFIIPGIIIIFLIGLGYFFVPIRGSTFRGLIKLIKNTNMSLCYGLIVTFGLSFFTFVKKKKKWQIGLVIYLAFLFIIMAELRASWLGLLVTLIFLSILLKKEAKIIIIIIPLMIVSLFIIDYFNLSLRENKLDKLKKEFAAMTLSHKQGMPRANIKWRLGIWRQTLDEIKEHPVFGWGYGIQIDYLIWKKRVSWLKAIGASTGIVPTHNHLLAIAYKMGLVGLALFLFINFRVFFYGWYYIKKCRSEFNRRFLIGSLASLVYWHGMAFFFDILESPPTGIFLWIILGSILGTVYVDKKNFASGGQGLFL